MKICLNCNKEIYPKRNDVTVRLNEGYGYYNADLFECDCGLKILLNFSSRNEDPSIKADFNINNI